MSEILVVEDEPLIRMVVAETLSDAGHIVREAANGEDALGVLRAFDNIRLIVTDVRMPKRDGFSLARAARAANPEMHLIFMTGYSEENVPEEFKTTCVLRKPFLPEIIVSKVQEIFEG